MKKMVKENQILMVFIIMALLILVCWKMLSFYSGPLPSMCFEYGYGDNGNTITITNYKCEIIKNVKIPQKIEGKEVTVIAKNAFISNGLKSVIIPNNVIEIGANAFDMNDLEKIIIPKNVTKIERGSFSSNNIKELTIPEGVTTIEPLAFSSNAIEELTLPDSLITIGSSSFTNNNLKLIVIPKNIQTIEFGAFENNPNLYKIINKTNKAFKWGEIINYSDDDTEFITGEVENICDDLVTVEPCESPNVEIVNK